MLRVHDVLCQRPLSTLKHVAGTTGLSFATASAAMDALASLGIAREFTGRQRNRVYAYDQYLAILYEGTERS
jgi:Fic family protein